MGGPLYQLLIRTHLEDSALGHLKKRIIVITLLAWLPLMLLSLIANKAWGGVGLPFLYDIETQIRFLVALPLLIVAELLVHQRLRLVVGQFIERDIITEEMLPKFREVIASAMKMRNSVAIELILFILIFVGGHYLWSAMSGITKIGTGPWNAAVTDGSRQLSPVGYWYIFVSRPLFQFIFIRWYLA